VSYGQQDAEVALSARRLSPSDEEVVSNNVSAMCEPRNGGHAAGGVTSAGIRSVMQQRSGPQVCCTLPWL
jgi:hypothetical protein